MLQAKTADFTKARINMIDSQIHTSGVVDPAILKAFQTTPRELFVPDHLATIAYNDEDLPVGHGRYLLEPMVHAKILQALEPKPHQVVLDIACGTGYSSAILSSLVSTVVTLENDQDLLERANIVWQHLGICNVASFIGDLKAGQGDDAPYDIILINGAVESVPQILKEQLAVGGKMIAIIKPAGRTLGQVTLIENLGDGNFSSYNLFSAGTPYLPGFEPRPTFTL